MGKKGAPNMRIRMRNARKSFCDCGSTDDVDMVETRKAREGKYGKELVVDDSNVGVNDKCPQRKVDNMPFILLNN